MARFKITLHQTLLLMLFFPSLHKFRAVLPARGQPPQSAGAVGHFSQMTDVLDGSMKSLRSALLPDPTRPVDPTLTGHLGHALPDLQVQKRGCAGPPNLRPV